MNTFPTSAAPQEVETFEDGRSVSDAVDEMIVRHQRNDSDITKLVLEATSLATASESRARHLTEQGFVSRLWGGLTGNNQTLRALNARDLSRAQFAAQKTLSRLAEQNGLTMNAVVAVQGQVGMVATDLNHLTGNVAQLWTTMEHFAQGVRDELDMMENRLERVEHENRLDNWANTIRVTEFRGTSYESLDLIPKLVCVVNDFFVTTKGRWDIPTDWPRLRQALLDVGVHYKRDVVEPRSFIHAVSEDATLLERFLDDTGAELNALESPAHCPPLFGLRKTIDYRTVDAIFVDTVLDAVPGRESHRDELALDLACSFVTRTTDAVMSKPVSVDNFCASVLVGMKLMRNGAVNTSEPQELIEDASPEEGVGIPVSGQPCDDRTMNALSSAIEALFLQDID